MRRAILLAVGLSACAPKLRSVEDEPITDAWLEHFDLSTVAVIGGIVDGDAFLGYTTADGETKSFGVHMGGPAFGIILDLTADPEWGPSIPLDLSDGEEDPIMLSDVLGTYRGTTASGVIGAGFDTRELHNKHGIGLQEDHLAFGIGLMVGFEWVRIREGGSEDGAVNDSGADDTGTGPPTDDTAGTDDSGAGDDTAIADDSATADDTASGDDTGAGDDTAGTGDDSGGQSPPPRRPPNDGGGDGCGGGDGADVDTDSGCCCSATNSAFIAGLWLLLGGRRRKRKQRA